MSSIEKAVEGFYIALNKLFIGDSQAMAEVWSHGSDVSYLGPQGEIVVGWDKVFPMFQSQAKLLLKGKIAPEEIHVFSHQDIAMTQNYEVGGNEVNGEFVPVKIRAMNLFRKEKGIWKMVSHQTDTLPFLS